MTEAVVWKAEGENSKEGLGMVVGAQTRVLELVRVGILGKLGR